MRGGVGLCAEGLAYARRGWLMRGGVGLCAEGLAYARRGLYEGGLYVG